MKKIALLTTVAILSTCINFSALAGEWRQNSTGRWYQNDDGTNPAAIWKQLDNKWYYFKFDGYMNTGWIKVSNQWYYCEPTGEMRISDLQTDVFNFKFNADGSCSNFYENTTPSIQGGWVSYGTTSLNTFADALLRGDIVYYNGQYWATPDYVSSLKNETVVYFNDISSGQATPPANRYGLADLDVNTDE